MKERTLFVVTFFGKDVFSGEKRGMRSEGKQEYFVLSPVNWLFGLLGRVNETRFSDTD